MFDPDTLAFYDSVHGDGAAVALIARVVIGSILAAGAGIFFFLA